MKKNQIILLTLIAFILVGSFIYTEYTKFQTFEFPNMTVLFNDEVIPLSNLDYSYDSLGFNKKMQRGDDDVLEFEIVDAAHSDFNLNTLIDIAPTDMNYVVTHEGTTIYDANELPDLQSLIINDNDETINQGDYTVNLNWSYALSDGVDFNGSGSATFKLTVKQPLAAVINETSVNPGEFVTVSSQYGLPEESFKIVTNLTGKPIETYEVDGGFEAFIPVDYRIASGDYLITVNYFENGIVCRSEEFPISVLEKDFPTQHLIMPESTVATTMTADTSAEYNAVLIPTRALKTPTRYFEEQFVAPTDGGIITTDFALTRYTNDNPIPSRHAALDIALPTGTAVSAVASGRAVVSRYLQLTGNTIMIDHGYGLISYYYHLDELKIEEGAMVTQNDLIATVGTTGYSTGPHLHFAISLNEIYLNPWFFFSFDGFAMNEN
ncbi:MAG: M23 family metallopeptidase [Turicibacter sp.]